MVIYTGTWLLLRLSNSGKGSETNTSGTSSGRRDVWETGTALMVDTLSVAAGNTAKDKRAKEASNRSQARGPPLRKARLNLGTTKQKHHNQLIPILFLGFLRILFGN